MTIDKMKRANEIQAHIKELTDQIERSEMDIDGASLVTLTDQCTKRNFFYYLDDADPEAIAIRDIFKRKALSLQKALQDLKDEFDSL